MKTNYGKGIRSNKRENASRAILERQSYNGSFTDYSKYDRRDKWEKDLEYTLNWINIRIYWGDTVETAETVFRGIYRDPNGVFTKAKEILSSPLYEALNEERQQDDSVIFRSV